MATDKNAAGSSNDGNAPNRLTHIAERLCSLSRLLAATTSLLYRGGLLALLVAVAVTCVVFISRITPAGYNRPQARYADTQRLAPAREAIPWDKVDAEVAAAAATSRAHAETFAASRLDTWNSQLLARIDNDFLPWYFGYWNQQVIGLKTIWQGGKYLLAGRLTASDTPSPSAQMTLDIQQEFSSRVLHPESAQLFLEQLTRSTAQAYLVDLRNHLVQVQATYKIPQPVWDRYLEDISVTTQRIEGGRTVPLSLKAVTVSSIGAGAMVAGSLARLAGSMETRLVSGSAERAGAKVAASLGEKVAARTGGKLLAKMGGRLLGPAAAVAIIAWDVYDHRSTVSENMPILRESLVEYLALLQDSLLHDPQSGVASAIYEIDTAITSSLTKDATQPAFADAAK